MHCFSAYEIHSRIELIVSDARAETAVGTILEESHTGLAGDGIIAVSPVDYMVKIRKKGRIVE